MKKLDTQDKVLIPVIIVGFLFIVGINIGMEVVIGSAISSGLKNFFIVYMLALLIVLVIIAIYVTNRFVKYPIEEITSFLEGIKNDKYTPFDKNFNNKDIDNFVIQINKIIKYLEEKDSNAKSLISTLKDSNKHLEEYQKAINASAIITRFDTKGKITYVNEQFLNISNYTNEELIGKPYNYLKHRDMEDEFFDSLWKKINNNEIWTGDIKNHDKSGKDYYTSTIIVPMLDFKDQISEYLSFSVDITEHIHSMQKAKNAEASKSIFLATMSHEIRTPLNGILGFTKLLEHSNLPKKEANYVNIVNSSASSLLGVINDILDISKIESGKLELEKKEFNPFKEFEPVIELFVAKANEKNIDILFYIDPNLPSKIIADPLKIKQVISNLIGNAIKFTPNKGSISVRIELEGKNEKTAQVLFSVKDSGIGIPKDKQKTIFDPFSQVDSSVTRKYGGTGLGLSISSNIISVMGSKIELLSEDNQGSEFYFILDLDYKKAKDLFPQIDINSKIAIYCDECDCKSQLGIAKKYLSNYSKPEVMYEQSQFFNYALVVINYEDLALIDKENLNVPFIIVASDENYKIDLKNKYIVLKSPINQSRLYDAIVEILNPNIEDEVFVNQNIDYEWEIKCLVVEDNIVNQHLMNAILTEKNINSIMANNGQEAVDIVKTGEKFDLIFMDINMPILNGIDATTLILEYEKTNNLNHTPIVALTANAIAGDKEKFLEAGMDDYMTKPFEEETLNSILYKYTQKKDAEKKENEEEIKSEKLSYSIDDSAKKLGIPVSVFRTILNTFFDSIDDDLSNLKEAIVSKNFTQIKELAHKIKGAAANLKMTEIADISQEIETAAKDEEESIDYEAKYEVLSSYLESIKSIAKN
ncbi:MAG: ATP-binding protein [Halarcobacter sp.]